MKSYESLLDLARREDILGMKQQAIVDLWGRDVNFTA